MHNLDIPKILNEATELHNSGMSLADIEKRLITLETSDVAINDLKALLKKLEHNRKRKRGTKTIAVGITLLGIGFLLTVFLFHSGSSINYAMYGFTIAGILIVFVGLMDIF